MLRFAEWTGNAEGIELILSRIALLAQALMHFSAVVKARAFAEYPSPNQMAFNWRSSLAFSNRRWSTHSATSLYAAQSVPFTIRALFPRANVDAHVVRLILTVLSPRVRLCVSGSKGTHGHTTGG